jgi:hypothetical protein
MNIISSLFYQNLIDKKNTLKTLSRRDKAYLTVVDGNRQSRG